MIKVFAPWSKALVQSPDALRLLKASGVIAGIEMSYMPADVAIVRASGLEVSIHNPLRDKFEVIDGGFLEDATLQQNLTKEILAGCSASNPPSVGFHAGYSIINFQLSKEEILERIKKNVDYLHVHLAKKPIAETPFHETSGLLKSTNHDAIQFVTSIAFVGELLSLDVGYLFDVAHMYINAYYREKAFNIPRDEHLAKLIDTTKDAILQIHFNVPAGDEAYGFLDAHGLIKDTENSLLALKLLQDVLEKASDVRTLTLEMNLRGPGIEQAQTIIAQANLLLEKVPLLKRKLFNAH